MAPSKILPLQNSRCGYHHCPSAQCQHLDPELLDALVAANVLGATIVTTDLPPLGYCSAYAEDCRFEQAVAVLQTTRPNLRDATFVVSHQVCVGCLEAAVASDVRGGYTVEVLIPDRVGVAA